MEYYTVVKHIRIKITDSKLKNKNILLSRLRYYAENILSDKQTQDKSLNELLLFISIVEIDLTLLENKFLN